MLTRRNDVYRLAAALVLVAPLLGCRPSGGQARADQARRDAQQQAHVAAAATGADTDADMVNAASPGGPGPPISLKFSLGGRPVAGQPLQIHVAMLPDTPNAIQRLYGSFTPGDGLALQSPRTFELRDLAAGVPLHQDVVVVPQQAGIMSLNATLILDFDTGSISRSFGIPLIVAPAPVTAPVTAAAPTPGTAADATAEAAASRDAAAPPP